VFFNIGPNAIANKKNKETRRRRVLKKVFIKQDEKGALPKFTALYDKIFCGCGNGVAEENNLK